LPSPWRGAPRAKDREAQRLPATGARANFDTLTAPVVLAEDGLKLTLP